MTPKWQKLGSLAQEICTLWFQYFGAFFASNGYPFKNIIHCLLRPNRTSEKETTRVCVVFRYSRYSLALQYE